MMEDCGAQFNDATAVAVPQQDGVRFRLKTIRKHIERNLPGCPADIREVLIERVRSRFWVGASIGNAIGIVATSYIRHHLTDYDRLLKHRLSQKEARTIIKAEVRDTFRAWLEREANEG